MMKARYRNEHKLVSNNYEWNNHRTSIIDTCESEVEECIKSYYG